MTRPDTIDVDRPSPEATPERWGIVLDALERIRFGSIQLTVHDGKLVQIDITEKTRIPA